MTPEIAYEYLFRTILLILAAYALCGICRAIKGPEIADRMLGVNMVGSAVIASTITLSAALSEGYLSDVAIIYAAVNFTSIVILNRVYVKKNGDMRK